MYTASVTSGADGTDESSACDAVYPLIGTAAEENTFPAATLPFGMIQWGPDTQPAGWYRYADHTIRGFSLTHLSGGGAPIFADVPILPWTGEVNHPGSAAEYVVSFSHARERAQPGGYAVELDNGVKAELTVALRAGLGRFTFPAGATRTLLVKAGSSATVDDAKRGGGDSMAKIHGLDTIVGSVHGGGFCFNDNHYVLYFVRQFDQPFAATGIWTTTVQPGGTSATGHKAGATAPLGPELAAFVRSRERLHPPPADQRRVSGKLGSAPPVAASRTLGLEFTARLRGRLLLAVYVDDPTQLWRAVRGDGRRREGCGEARPAVREGEWLGRTAFHGGERTEFLFRLTPISGLASRGRPRPW